MSDTNHPANQRSLSELIAESKRLSEHAEAIRRQMDDVAEQIAKRVGDMESRARTDKPSAPPH